MAKFTDLPPEVLQEIADLCASGVTKYTYTKDMQKLRNTLSLRLLFKDFSPCIVKAAMREITCLFGSGDDNKLDRLLYLIDKCQCASSIRILCISSQSRKGISLASEAGLGQLLSIVTGLQELMVDVDVLVQWSTVFRSVNCPKLQKADIRTTNPLVVVRSLYASGITLGNLSILYVIDAPWVSVEGWKAIDLSSVQDFTLYDATTNTSLRALRAMPISPTCFRFDCDHQQGDPIPFNALFSHVDHPLFSRNLQCIIVSGSTYCNIGEIRMEDFCRDRKLPLGIEQGPEERDIEWLIPKDKPLEGRQAEGHVWRY